jgi:hypothetical protein
LERWLQHTVLTGKAAWMGVLGANDEASPQAAAS